MHIRVGQNVNLWQEPTNYLSTNIPTTFLLDAPNANIERNIRSIVTEVSAASILATMRHGNIFTLLKPAQ